MTKREPSSAGEILLKRRMLVVRVLEDERFAVEYRHEAEEQPDFPFLSFRTRWRTSMMNRKHDFDHPSVLLTPSRAFLGTNWQSEVAAALIVLMICGLVAVRSAIAQDVPTATIELSGGSVAAGIGYTWGSGTLIFEGKKYPIKVDGLSIIHVGVSGYTASGTVYKLTKLSDINGVYTAFSAGAAIAGGASATAMKNSHGVVIQMVSTHAGLNFSLGPKGVTIKLEHAS